MVIKEHPEVFIFNMGVKDLKNLMSNKPDCVVGYWARECEGLSL